MKHLRRYNEGGMELVNKEGSVILGMWTKIKV